jgi:hypothetical protein
MVKRLLIGSLLLILIPAFAAAQEVKRDPYDGGEKYGEIRPYKVTPARKVIIRETGKWSDLRSSSDETQQDCAAFKPRETDIREFFHRARRVSFSTYLNNLDASRCYATGEIDFENGDRGTWVIDAGRRGVLTLSDGINLYFFCTKCRANVFYEY